MIDIHNHILPGVDDGASSLTESMAMAREAVKEGIDKIIATPHHKNGEFTNTAEQIIGAVEYLNHKLQEENISVQVLPGQETRIYGEMLEDLEKGELLPLNKTSGYVFVELPTEHVPRYTTQLLFDMQISGYKPIIVHPERNHELMESPDKLYRLVKNGALTQITAGSITGKTGKKVQKFAYQLLEANLTHFIGSDAHGVKKRSFYMREALADIKKHVGNHTTYQLMENNEAIVSGHGVYMDPPERIAMKKKWGIFSK